MKTMRVSVTAQEILTVFKYYHQNRKALTVWQNINGTRTKVEAIVFEYTDKGDIRFLSLGREMPFKPEYPLYIYGEHKTLLFKTTAKSMIAGELWVPLPKMVRFEEMRKIKRFNLSELKNCMVTVRKHLDASPNKDYSFQINDLSSDGMSFFMGQDHSLKIGDVLQINQIQNDQLSYTLNGEIVHTSPKINSQGIMDIKLMKVGVRFRYKLRIKDLYIYKKVIKDLM